MRDPTSVREENEASFIRVWKPLPSRRVLKTLKGSPKGKAQRGQYLLAVSLGRYKRYQSQTPGDLTTRRLNPKGGWTQGGVPARTLGPEGGELGGPTWIGEGNKCQRGRWAPKRGGLWDPTSVGEENKASFIRVSKPLPSRCVLKTLRGSPKGKAQREQYLLSVGLGRYKWYQSQTPGNVPARRLSPDEGWTGVPTRTLDPKGRWIGGPTLIGEGNEGTKEGWIVRSHISRGGERSILIRVWKPLPRRRVLKTLRRSSKRKAQREQHLLTVDLVRHSYPNVNSSDNTSKLRNFFSKA